jgi:hypothetical protein
MTLTVVKKGQEIEFDSQFDTLNAAKGYLAQFMAYNSFAMDLLSKRKLSEKQEAWVHYLATEHKVEAEAPVVEGEFISLVEKMYAGVKTPTRKFHLHLPSGVSISTITKGVNQGGLYIFENSNYVAKITDKGVLKGDVSEDVRLILEDACDNLLKLAQLYGHESGNCAVCHRPLTDPKSLSYGIGPICMKRLEQ